MLLNFEQGPIRPPDEADSLLIRTTRGCPWNRCHFCTLYKDIQFTIRPLEEIKQDILAAKDYFGGHPFETCFLQDGDSFTMRTPDLLEILQTLKEIFPSLKTISSYGRAQTMARKSAAEMAEICDAGLNKLYCGMESGSLEVLEQTRKGTTPKTIIESSHKAKQAGMQLMMFTLLGLGGRELTDEHAKGSAEVLNQVDPTEVRLLSLVVKPGTGFAKMMDEGTFTLLTEVEMIEEQRRLLQQLTAITSWYVNYHSVNLMQEIRGNLPEDKAWMLSIIDQFLAMPLLEQQNFILGRRIGCYHRLADHTRSPHYEDVQKQLEKIQQAGPGAFDSIVHDLRGRFI